MMLSITLKFFRCRADSFCHTSLPIRPNQPFASLPSSSRNGGVFLIRFSSWLNGTQRHFIMPAGLQSSREITHYAQVFRLADQAGLLTKPDLAEQRMASLLALHGMA